MFSIAARRLLPVVARHQFAPTQRLSPFQGIRMSRDHATRVYGKEGVVYLDRDEVTARVLKVVRRFNVKPTEVTPTSKFADLGLDSIGIKELVMALEREFRSFLALSSKDWQGIHSVDEAVAFFSTNPKANFTKSTLFERFS
eukprot:NODE_6622_length_516_cov_22.848329_g6456_i0.p1 GENE.NODE_6622_length_516_cov_22.848329_g6456_i0~~NODE_6622_length_516_cov_22.848329_g6456_i0.p1  ORF type:complete len:142 (+),score=28.20 NODE_6622_length_516_cov_22.848329_g6456_i0:49-474(+)